MFSFLNTSRPTNSLHKKIELLANVAIVVIAILLGFVLVKTLLSTSVSKS